jgi:hypothetical protein
MTEKELIQLKIYRIVFTLKFHDDTIAKTRQQCIIADNIGDVIDYPYYTNNNQLIVDITHIKEQQQIVYTRSNMIPDYYCRKQLWEVKFLNSRYGTVFFWMDVIKDVYESINMKFKDLQIEYIYKDSSGIVEIARPLAVYK